MPLVVPACLQIYYQMHINEMTKFAEDSTAKMRSIRAAAEGLWSKTRADLPEEDFVLLTRCECDGRQGLFSGRCGVGPGLL